MVPKSKKKLCIITMATLFSISFITLVLILTIPCSSSSACRRPKPNPPIISPPSLIVQACNGTRFPLLCQSTLQNATLPPSTTSLNLTAAAISLIVPNIKTALSMVSGILIGTFPPKDKGDVAANCLGALRNAQSRIGDTLNAAFPKGKVGMKDSRAWISAALDKEYGCWSSLKYVNDTAEVNEAMAFLDNLTQQTSNALSMLVAYDVYGNDVASWRSPRTERDGFWEGVPVSGFVPDRTLSFPTVVKAEVTVCQKKGVCDYEKIQDAVGMMPVTGNRTTPFVISIKEGIYDEIVRVPFDKKNVIFVGDGMGKTIITGSLSVGISGLPTYDTATLGEILNFGYIFFNFLFTY